MSQRERLVTTTAAGGMFLTFHPSSLRYRTSRQAGEPEPAAVRFNGETHPVYPLHWYREELMLAEGQPFPGDDAPKPKIEHKPLRQALERWEDRGVWIAGSGFAYVALVAIGVVLALRRREPLEIAKRYFKLAAGSAARPLAPAVLGLAGVDPAHGALAGQFRDLLAGLDAPGVTLFLAADKIYLVYGDLPPAAGQLAPLRERSALPIVPIAVWDMERALAEKSASAEHLRRLEDPFVVRPDPYDESRAVEWEVLFYGRKEALERIPPSLLQGQSVAIFGLRKVGKTSLLNRLRRALNAQPFVLIDCQIYALVAVDLFNEILSKLHGELLRLGLKGLPKQEAISNPNGFREKLLPLYQAWSRHPAAGRIIVAFDELDKYFPERRDAHSEDQLREFVMLFRMLRGLAQEHRCLSVLAVAYRPDINRHDLLTEAVGENPMAHSFQEYFLGFLGREDTATMIRELGRWRSIEWEDAGLDRVFELSGGHPLLARFIASDACEQGSNKQVTMAKVEETERQIRRTLYRHRLGTYLKESVWGWLRLEERAVLRMIVAGGEAGVRGAQIGRAREEARANLEHFGLLAESAAAIHIRGRLLRDWVNEYEVPHDI